VTLNRNIIKQAGFYYLFDMKNLTVDKIFIHEIFKGKNLLNCNFLKLIHEMIVLNCHDIVEINLRTIKIW
jgi:hypothetical protein